MQEEYLLNLLKEYQIDYQLHHHEPLFSTEQSTNLHEVVLGAHSKNLLPPVLSLLMLYYM